MITLNVNMFVEPDVPVVPMWTQTGSFDDAIPLGHTLPQGMQSNTNVANPYYLKTNVIAQDGKLIIYIPIGNDIGQFFQASTGGTWVQMESSAFTTAQQTINGNQYKTYTYYSIDGEGEPNYAEIILSLTIV